MKYYILSCFSSKQQREIEAKKKAKFVCNNEYKQFMEIFAKI